MVSNSEFPLSELSTFSEVKVAFRTNPGSVISQCGPAGLVRYPAVMAHARKNNRSEAVSVVTLKVQGYRQRINLFAISSLQCLDEMKFAMS